MADIKRVKGLDFFPQLLKISEDSIVYSDHLSFAFLGVSVFKRIDEIIVDEGS